MSTELGFECVDEQDEFWVINKYPGISMHSENTEIGLCQRIKNQFNSKECLPVHRLDKVTSGIVLLAKNHKAASELSLLFQNRQVEKYYIAISDRKPKKKQGLIIGDMTKARRGAWKLEKTKKNPAITQFFSSSIGQGRRLYWLKPSTGKTHQIRVALRSIGAPIIGDSSYYSPVTEANKWDRTYLHAYSLAFVFQGVEYRYQVKPTSGKLFVENGVSECLKKEQNPNELPWPTLKNTPI
ncbi:MAG: TIGR01621 family pseudouridine synthase [Pseudomonadales bacterium]|nr:TIGR01621 family pseudouridine synthase [Pseudomonadales bacterium]